MEISHLSSSKRDGDILSPQYNEENGTYIISVYTHTYASRKLY